MLLRGFLGALLFATACTGDVMSQSDEGGGDNAAGGGDSGQNGGGSGGQRTGGGNGAIGGNAVPIDPELGGLSLRRLTKWEYENTIGDLLGAPASFAASYSKDDVSNHGFATATNTSELMATSAMESAEALATFGVGRLASVAPCAASASDACAKEFIANFGQRAYRRPLSTGEKDELFTLFSFARKDLALDFPNGIRVLLSAILQAPQFLYHWELGEEKLASKDNAVALGAYQLASRLSYFVWGSMPDATLFDAAKAGKLNNKADLEQQAKRMLSDKRSRAMVADFFTQLLYLDGALRSEKDTKTHPEWTAAMRTSAFAESRTFVQDVVLDGDGLWRSLLTANHSFVDENLAKLYAVPGVSGGSFVRKDLPTEQRSGLLTQAAFLSSTGGATDGALITPIHRGLLIRKRLLCQPIPPPQANIQARPSNGITVRERLATHASDPQCASCHSLMDDLGFAFENYDVTGKWRTQDNGKAVDASGEISNLDSGTPKFKNAIEMAKLLSTAPEAQECMASNLLRYGLGRIDTDGEASLLLRGLRSPELNVRDALLAVVLSKGFSQRLLSQGEVLP